MYGLVGVYYAEQPGENIPFVRGLKRKTAEEVSKAIKSIFAEIRCIFGENVILKAHSDAGGEFINREIKAHLTDQEIWQTSTAGYDPKGNGRVERFVGILKHRATIFLLHSKMPLAFWCWAMMQAAYEYRCRILDTPLPDTAPRFGDRVLIQKPLPHFSFQSKVEEGRFLSWDTTALQGALVATVRSGTLKVVSASAPLPWPKNGKREK